MNYIGKFISNFKDFYNEINSATLTGAIDVVMIKQPDGTYLCSPFHVRFGKIGVLRSREKVVDIEVNGSPVDIHMKLGDSGEAFFVQEVEDENDIIPMHLATSPLPLVPDIEAELKKMKLSNGFDDGTTSGRQKLITGMHTSSEQTTIIIKNKTAHTSDGRTTVIVRSSHAEAVCQNDPISNREITFESPKNRNIETSVDSQTEISTVETFVSKDSMGTSDETQMDGQEDYKTKRKKRKKTAAKKRNKSREIAIPSPPVRRTLLEQNIIHSDVIKGEQIVVEKPEEMFQMDDDYGENEEDEGYPSASNGLSRSLSLPVSGNQLLSGEWSARKMSSTFTGEFHPFSDGDVTPHSSPTGSRPPSPKSDTEYENQKQDAMSQTDTGAPSWGWGQLPNVPRSMTDAQLANGEKTVLPPNADGINKVEDSTDAEKRSMLGGMLNFMRSTKKMRHMPESEGIFLDDINTDDLDPEVAALYFPKFKSPYFPQGEANSRVKDEDAESGNGTSLPHSPHSVDGAIGGLHSQDSDSDDRQSLFDCYHICKFNPNCRKPYSDIAMSLCGGLPDIEAELLEERFLHSVVTYDEFTENPSILLNPSMVIRMGGKFYNWSTASPMLMSMIMFQKPLPEKTTNQLIGEHMPKKKKSKSYSSWWSWRRSEAEKTADTIQQNAQDPTNSENIENTNSTQVSEDAVCDSNEDLEVKTECDEALINDKSLPETPEIHSADEKSISNEELLDSTTPVESSLLHPIQTELTLTAPSSSSSSIASSPVNINSSRQQEEILVPDALTPETDAQTNDAKETISFDLDKTPHVEKYKKSLRLTSEQIVSLSLTNGKNEVIFSVTTAYQGTTRCKCHIYLWNYDDKIVISDIDGTITKSDVLGHILPIIGRDWAQLGVAKLFTKVQSNGYQFLYLSARAIGQARITRDYLRSIRQGEVCLPDGPLLLSPTSLISALHREVIERKPEEFKIRCLKDIQTLFPSYMGNPFYAGFGNKINDTWAYRAVEIPITRVFTINHKGELKLELIQTFQSSYTRLSDQVDHMFPPLNPCNKINGHLAPSFTSSEEFSYFTYWRDPVGTVGENDLPL